MIHGRAGTLQRPSAPMPVIMDHSGTDLSLSAMTIKLAGKE